MADVCSMHDRNSCEKYEHDRSSKLRMFYSRYVTQRGGAADPRIQKAFATVPREAFVGPPPWFIIGTLPLFPAVATYTETPDGDLAFLYQDVLIALDPRRGMNIGDPSLHAFSLAAIAIREGETVIHVGCGSGYYTAIIASLVGFDGHIHAFEIDADMAVRARDNLSRYPQIDLHERSGADATLPAADAIYVNAAFTRPAMAWLKALKPGGRLLFPLQQARGLGGMLLVERPQEDSDAWPARFITRAVFIAGHDLEDVEAGQRLESAFASVEAWQHVRSLRFDDVVDQTCWLRGNDWWLSTSAADGLAP